MEILSGCLLLIISLYTAGFGITTWKEKNKIGALAILSLAAVILVLPFFTIFKS
ncbi:hypothetical protein LCL95_01865 [Bacillus timonensis]|nr:hypothetical protein [Bacillus timonensis]